MTKEEMINSERVLNDLGIWQKEVIARVMQNYAEQRATAFAEWINSDKCDYFPVLDVHNWINDNADKITTEQLYELFKKQK